MVISNHAAQRLQERNIPPLIVEWLYEFGAVVRSHGADKLYFDKAARRRLESLVGHEVISRLGGLLDHYLVINGDRLVTAARRTCRVRR